jgi:hypothetical protein
VPAARWCYDFAHADEALDDAMAEKARSAENRYQRHLLLPESAVAQFVNCHVHHHSENRTLGRGGQLWAERVTTDRQACERAPAPVDHAVL